MMFTKDVSKEQELAIDQKGDLLLTWINDTTSLFEKEVKSERAIDHLCITSLAVSLTYCMAITSLLKIGIRMPTKALLRVLFELGVKITWCMVLPHDEQEPDDKIISERIKRWAKSSLNQKVKILKSMLDCLPKELRAEAQNRLSDYNKQMSTLDCREMPNLCQMVSDLPEVWSKQLYPQCYLQFNDAVHLDLHSLGRQEREETHQYAVVCDDNDSTELLMQYCMSLEHIILWIVRHHYGWKTDVMDNQFKA